MKFRLHWLVIGIVATLVVGARSDAGEKKNPATTPLNRDIKRHKEFVAIAQKGDVDVLFIGDSITHAWESAGQQVWKKHFEPLKAANFGIGGDQTGHVLWRITEGKELEGIAPKVAVLMIGTNNTGGQSAEQIADGIKVIVKTIHDKSPKTKVLLLAIFPRGEKAGTPIREKISAINKNIASLDDGGKTVKYLDIGAKFLSEDGSLSKDIMPDFLHLTPRGYEIWAEAILPSVQGLMK